MKGELLAKIKEEVLNLKSSPLYQERVKNKVWPVIGEGSHDAKIMFIGEAPGEKEALSGRPFCGSAGRVLDKLLAEIELERKDVYVTNIVKDRPPSNRDPLPEEIDCYGPFLDRQIEIIDPVIIATLGRFSTHYILDKYNIPRQPISSLRGSKIKIGSRWLVPLFHPAVALYSPSKMQILKKDFLFLKKFAIIEK